MADRIRNAEDRRLDAMLRTAPLADDGFTDCVLRRVRRRIWLRRLVLPCAAAIGGALAFEPAVALVRSIAGLRLAMAPDLMMIPVAMLPSATVVVLGAMLLLAVALGLRMLEEF